MLGSSVLKREFAALQAWLHNRALSEECKIEFLRNSLMVRLTDSVNNIYEVSEHSSQQGFDFWVGQVRLTSNLLIFTPFYYSHYYLQCAKPEPATMDTKIRHRRVTQAGVCSFNG